MKTEVSLLQRPFFPTESHAPVSQPRHSSTLQPRQNLNPRSCFIHIIINQGACCRFGFVFVTTLIEWGIDLKNIPQDALNYIIQSEQTTSHGRGAAFLILIRGSVSFTHQNTISTRTYRVSFACHLHCLARFHRNV